MNPLFIFGSLAIIGAMVAMQSQGYGDGDGDGDGEVDRGNPDDPMFLDTSIPGMDFRGTGASEEAYWSDFGEGRHIRVPGRLG